MMKSSLVALRLKNAILYHFFLYTQMGLVESPCYEYPMVKRSDRPWGINKTYPVWKHIPPLRVSHPKHSD